MRGQNLPSSHHHIICEIFEICLLSIYTSNYCTLLNCDMLMEIEIITSVVITFYLVRDCMSPCDLWLLMDRKWFFFFFNFCFIASCLKCIRFQFSGKLKRFSVKTSSFIVGCRNCTEETCHHLFVCFIYLTHNGFELFESKKHINLQGPWRTGCSLH